MELGGKNMLSRRDSNYDNDDGSATLKQERNSNLIVEPTLLLLPGYGPLYH